MRNANRWTTTAVTLLGIVALGAGNTAAAASASKQETIGVGSGALIGALAGGPVGFVIGAAVGAKIGDTMHQKQTSIETLTARLDGASHTVDELHGEVRILRGEIDRLENTAQPELLALMQAGIDMDLLFRTDAAALTDTTGERLHGLAARIAAMPAVRVQLDGFADGRGAEDYNLALSAQRVEYVRQLFVMAGVSPARISVSAHGESAATADDTDGYALERRVSVKLFVDSAESLAAAH